MGVGFLGVGFLGTILSWFLLVYFGRPMIYNSGLGLLAVLQIVIGILDCVPNYIDRPGVIWTQSSLMVIWNFFYDLVSRSPTIYHLNSNADVRETLRPSDPSASSSCANAPPLESAGRRSPLRQPCKLWSAS